MSATRRAGNAWFFNVSLLVLLLPSTCLFAQANPVVRKSVKYNHGTQATPKNDPTGLSKSEQSLVISDLKTIATHSWELGTECETLLEVLYPALSVFSVGQSHNAALANLKTLPPEIADIINPVLERRGNILPLIDDTAAGDPASLGVCAILGNVTTTNQIKSGQTPTSSINYGSAVADQLYFLLTQVPRTNDGAISHRDAQVQLWSDFVYMAPPFIAYYGFMTSNSSLIDLSYQQIKLYRNYLRDPQTNLWKHIVLGSDFQDLSLWSTGNAWVTMGILRVAATMGWALQSSTMNLPPQEIKNIISMRRDLLAWTAEIVDAAFTYQNSTSGLLRNYIADPTSFEEVSGTALLSASAFRLAILGGSQKSLKQADLARQQIKLNNIDPSTGYVAPVVNPLQFNALAPDGVHSPEAQAFVLMQDAAYHEWQEWKSQKNVLTSAKASFHIDPQIKKLKH